MEGQGRGWSEKGSGDLNLVGGIFVWRPGLRDFLHSFGDSHKKAYRDLRVGGHGKERAGAGGRGTQ